LAGRVPLKIIYLIVRLVAALAVLVFRRDLAKDAELLVLRHENAVLRRHAGRTRYEPADRVWFTALARLIPRERWAGVFPVTPATLLTWHRRLARESTTRANGASPAARRQSAASPALSFAWRKRIRCGATAGSTAS
jgi:putative transposase